MRIWGEDQILSMCNTGEKMQISPYDSQILLFAVIATDNKIRNNPTSFIMPMNQMTGTYLCPFQLNIYYNNDVNCSNYSGHVTEFEFYPAITSIEIRSM